MTGRGINWILLVKCVWITANLSLLLLGLGSCVTEPYCSFAENNILPVLCLLSFPGSVFFILMIVPFIDFDPAANYMLFCLGVMLVGYFQWFHLTRALFGQQKLTRLGLDRLTPPNEKTDPKSAADQARLDNFKPAQILAFDRAGHTPLERVLKRTPRS